MTKMTYLGQLGKYTLVPIGTGTSIVNKQLT